MQSIESQLTFRRNMSPPSAGRKKKLSFDYTELFPEGRTVRRRISGYKSVIRDKSGSSVS
jgi:hypothetical protein